MHAIPLSSYHQLIVISPDNSALSHSTHQSAHKYIVTARLIKKRAHKMVINSSSHPQLPTNAYYRTFNHTARIIARIDIIIARIISLNVSNPFGKRAYYLLIISLSLSADNRDTYTKSRNCLVCRVDAPPFTRVAVVSGAGLVRLVCATRCVMPCPSQSRHPLDTDAGDDRSWMQPDDRPWPAPRRFGAGSQGGHVSPGQIARERPEFRRRRFWARPRRRRLFVGAATAGRRGPGGDRGPQAPRHRRRRLPRQAHTPHPSHRRHGWAPDRHDAPPPVLVWKGASAGPPASSSAGRRGLF